MQRPQGPLEPLVRRRIGDGAGIPLLGRNRKLLLTTSDEPAILRPQTQQHTTDGVRKAGLQRALPAKGSTTKNSLRQTSRHSPATCDRSSHLGHEPRSSHYVSPNDQVKGPCADKLSGNSRDVRRVPLNR